MIVNFKLADNTSVYVETSKHFFNYIIIYYIIILGSSTVHKEAPLVKSIMLAGPRGTGKKLLVHALCNETGANLFDLTATNLAGKYPGKDGLKLLMHMIFKVFIFC